MNTIGQRIKERREELGLKQAELAKLAGFKSTGAIGNYESGTRSAPRNLLGLSRALKVRPEWLETGKGKKELDQALIKADPNRFTSEELLFLEVYRQQPSDEVRKAAIVTLKLGVNESSEISDHSLPASKESKRANGR